VLGTRHRNTARMCFRRQLLKMLSKEGNPMTKEYLALVDTTTRGRYDVTPLFADAEAFKSLVQDLSGKISATSPTVIAGIDALGFVLGAAIARELELGIIPVRKAGKLPCEVHSVSFIDYSGTQKSLELRKGILRSTDRVVIVDEWVETGAQALAAMSLIRLEGATVVGIASINFDATPGVGKIRAEVPCFKVWPESAG